GAGARRGVAEPVGGDGEGGPGRARQGGRAAQRLAAVGEQDGAAREPRVALAPVGGVGGRDEVGDGAQVHQGASSGSGADGAAPWIGPSVRLSGATCARPCRTATTSAATETATSSGVTAPRSRPMGERRRASPASVTPSARSASTR